MIPAGFGNTQIDEKNGLFVSRLPNVKFGLRYFQLAGQPPFAKLALASLVLLFRPSIHCNPRLSAWAYARAADGSRLAAILVMAALAWSPRGSMGNLGTPPL
jgi:hypothetical protein